MHYSEYVKFISVIGGGKLFKFVTLFGSYFFLCLVLCGNFTLYPCRPHRAIVNLIFPVCIKFRGTELSLRRVGLSAAFLLEGVYPLFDVSLYLHARRKSATSAINRSSRWCFEAVMVSGILLNSTNI